MKRSITTTLAAAGVLAVVAAPAAVAMGSGNPYLDFQVGVTYTVYQPTFTAGIKQVKVTSMADAGAQGEANLSAAYGKKNGRNFRIQEGNPMTTDIGQGALVSTQQVQGRTAKIYAYCDPASTKKCTMADISKVGGHLDVTLPAAAGLRETRIWVETIQPAPISGQQLVSIAKSLQRVG